MKLEDVYHNIKYWLSQQFTIQDQNRIRIDLLVDTIGYLCLKSRFKDALIQSDFANFINSLANLVVRDEEEKKQVIAVTIKDSLLHSQACQ